MSAKSYQSSRSFRKAKLEKYYSPTNIAEKIRELCVYKTTYVDPCAGANALYNVLPEPKLRFDIEDGVDFFSTSRHTFVETPITFVMNPPFTISGHCRRNGVVMFLNHASSCLYPKEYIVCVVPQTMRKWCNISQVDVTLHLKEEHIFEKPCLFSQSNRNKKVSVAIQVWEKQTTPRLEPVLLRSHKCFTASFIKPADFYMRVWGVLEKIGEVAKDTPKKLPNKRKYSTMVGTLPMSGGGGGTAIGIKATKGDADTVYKRFHEMFHDKEWSGYMRYKCAGNNNPVVTTQQIYTLFEKGIDYLKKNKYGIKTYIIY